jgi:hypothetical protein
MAADPEFDPAQLGEALDELGRIALQAGRVIDVAIYGGSCLVLVSNFRLATRDVDAVAAVDQRFLDEAGALVAERHGWSKDWLNDGVRTYLSPRVEGFQQHVLFRSYPNEASPGLRVFVPTAEYMLAMKLMALRIDPAAEAKDFDDIINLMQVVGLSRKEEILEFASRFYPDARISAKLRLSTDILWNAYTNRRQATTDDPPPRYLG